MYCLFGLLWSKCIKTSPSTFNPTPLLAFVPRICVQVLFRGDKDTRGHRGEAAGSQRGRQLIMRVQCVQLEEILHQRAWQKVTKYIYFSTVGVVGTFSTSFYFYCTTIMKCCTFETTCLTKARESHIQYIHFHCKLPRARKGNVYLAQVLKCFLKYWILAELDMSYELDLILKDMLIKYLPGTLK